MDKTFFSGKVAVVTGAGGTLASVIAEDLALKGVKVLLIGRTQSKLEKVAEKIRSHDGICLIMAGNVNNEDEIRQIADKVKADWGPCSFLINGAGGNNIR